jgi:hypothetical protein
MPVTLTILPFPTCQSENLDEDLSCGGGEGNVSALMLDADHFEYLVFPNLPIKDLL